MTDQRDRGPREGDEQEQARVQHKSRPRVEGDRPEPPEDPDRPTDEVWDGNILREPAPGD
ncbi:hypothetical protein [Miltoncostaea marina]|uniref:hypothetical protein n=1 Tax=Miltoncostaea marina TaxID=2843215 RepID=UPI001C3C53EB|nr:hypothetical protein [Miltoncostaea marina]